MWRSSCKGYDRLHFEGLWGASLSLGCVDCLFFVVYLSFFLNLSMYVDVGEGHTCPWIILLDEHTSLASSMSAIFLCSGRQIYRNINIQELVRGKWHKWQGVLALAEANLVIQDFIIFAWNFCVFSVYLLIFFSVSFFVVCVCLFGNLLFLCWSSCVIQVWHFCCRTFLVEGV